MYWSFDVKTVDLRDSYTVGGADSMNIIIAPVSVLNMPEGGKGGICPPPPFFQKDKSFIYIYMSSYHR